MASLHNRVNKSILKERLAQEPFPRITISFYKYFIINEPDLFRDQLYEQLNEINVFGRIYLANEGINAQISVPEDSWKAFLAILDSYTELKNIRINKAIEDDGKSFYKLMIKVRHKIVADGLDDGSFDVTNVGRHLSAKEFNDALNEGAIVVDMRNHYESEVGHFQGAICPDVDTFKEELPHVIDLLKDKKKEKVLLYCTGGIRCEKASAYFRHKGFEDVNQLYGGIIQYVKQIKENDLDNKFIGKNFVFDERLGERISDDIISSCHQCGEPCDTHVNCANDDCHLLFIQCQSCAEKMNNCCSLNCSDIIKLPIEEQRKLRKGKKKTNAHSVYNKGRLRPKL